MNKKDLGGEILRISKRIRTIKNAANKVRSKYNNHYFKSIVGNRKVGGIRAEHYGYENDEDIVLAKSCGSLDEWRQKFVEDCIDEKHNPNCVRQLNNEIGNYTPPPCSYPECSRLYAKVGGDSLFWVFHYKRRMNGLDALLKEEQAKYSSVLEILLQPKSALP